jgi:hypothetical protein
LQRPLERFPLSWGGTQRFAHFRKHRDSSGACARHGGMMQKNEDVKWGAGLFVPEDKIIFEQEVGSGKYGRVFKAHVYGALATAITVPFRDVNGFHASAAIASPLLPSLRSVCDYQFI